MAVFGAGSSHARHDDLVTDFRAIPQMQQLGVPVVTAFQVLRVVAVLMTVYLFDVPLRGSVALLGGAGLVFVTGTLDSVLNRNSD